MPEDRRLALFHGSKKPLEPNTVITPRSRDGLAFASHEIYTAGHFAGRVKKTGEVRGHVYEVEPVSTEGVNKRVMNYTGKEEHWEVTSPHGFRVVQPLPKSLVEAAYYNPDGEGEPPWPPHAPRNSSTVSQWKDYPNYSEWVGETGANINSSQFGEVLDA